MELTAKQARAVSVTSLAFPGDTVNNFILGSEDGVVYSGQRHGNKKVNSDVIISIHQVLFLGWNIRSLRAPFRARYWTGLPPCPIKNGFFTSFPHFKF